MPALAFLPGRFAICRLDPGENIPQWAMGGLFWSVTRTGEELSLVCPEENLPEGVISEKGWCCLRVEGPLDLGEVGVLVSLALPLREAHVSIFVVSTYLTDYILLKERDLGPAVQALTRAGHVVVSEKGEKISMGDPNPPPDSGLHIFMKSDLSDFMTEKDLLCRSGVI